MDRFLSAALLGSMAVLTVIPAHGQQIPNPQPDMKSAFANADFSPLPALPKGKSTILGGQIRSLDPVLDQFTLRIFGERPMKILFDERTQVYRNGVRIPLHELRPEEHVSVQTALEGSNVFAISIHMLSDLPQGETQGHILGYNPASGELTVGSSLTRDPIRLVVRPATQVVRVGQSAFTSQSAGQADLVAGALVNVRFDADEKGRAVADRVTVLARPGSDFAFSGKLSSLDMHSGILVILDPRDQKSYQISFNPGRLPISGSVHPGDQVRVTATYDGVRYTAIELVQNQQSQP
jgi:hypothetical protein